jgi:hypothetical protein
MADGTLCLVAAAGAAPHGRGTTDWPGYGASDMRVRASVWAAAIMIGGWSAASVWAADFDRCGQFGEGVECILFHADDGGVFVVSEHGSYGVGDRVRIIGTLDPNCASTCMQGDGCVVDNTVEPCAGDFDACGILVDGVECTLFESDDGGLFALSDLGAFAVGDRVHVIGAYDPNCVSICQQGNGCVQNDAIEPAAAACPNDVPNPLPSIGLLELLQMLLCPAFAGTLAFGSFVGRRRARSLRP